MIRLGTLNIDFEFAEVYRDFIDDFINTRHHRYSLYGGRNSAKSGTLYRLALQTVMSTGCVMVVRRYKNSLKGSSYNNIKKVISELGIDKYFKCVDNPREIRCLITGYVISFAGLDDPQKIKSSVAPKGFYKLVVFEESQEINRKEFCDEAISSFERDIKNSDFKVLWAFNPPPNKLHWCNTELRHSIPDYLYSLQVNYCDIPADWVGPEINQINRLKAVNNKLYRYRYLGEPIAAEDVIFENIAIEDISDNQINKWISQDSNLFVGLDFGYSPDPNAGNMMYYDPISRDLYIFKEYHSYKQNNKQISEGLLKAGFSQDYIITCDNDQKTIDDLRSYGWSARPAKKQKLRDAGFKWLQGLNRIIIDSRCIETIREFEEYHYVIDRDGNQKSMYPEGQADHHIAATRYALERLFMRAGQ